MGVRATEMARGAVQDGKQAVHARGYHLVMLPWTDADSSHRQPASRGAHVPELRGTAMCTSPGTCLEAQWALTLKPSLTHVTPHSLGPHSSLVLTGLQVMHPQLCERCHQAQH